MDRKKFEALLTLLNDPDENTYQALVRSLTLDADMIPYLERLWQQAGDETAVSRLDWLIRQARLNKLVKGMAEWRGKTDALLEGAWLVACCRYPDLTFAEVDDAVAAIAKDVWLELRDGMTPREQVAVINRVLFGKHGIRLYEGKGLKGVLINDVLRFRKGETIGLVILYICVAQKLHLPVYSVPLIRHCTLGWLNDDSPGQNVEFYINLCEEGKIFDEDEALQLIQDDDDIDFDEAITPDTDEKTITWLVSYLAIMYKIRDMNDAYEDMDKIRNAVMNRTCRPNYYL